MGDAILAAVAPPTVPDDASRCSTPAAAGIPGAVARRIDALRQWRTDAAPRFGLEPGLLLPNRLIGAVAAAGPGSRDALASVDGFAAGARRRSARRSLRARLHVRR